MPFSSVCYNSKEETNDPHQNLMDKGGRMMRRTESITYFDKPGPEHTQETLRLCIEESSRLESKTLVIPSTTGNSALMAMDMLSNRTDIRLVVVGHRYGFREQGKNEMPDEVIEKIRNNGHCLWLGTHLLTGLEKDFINLYGGLMPHRLIADTFRIFSQGVKVLFEDAVMAADAGMVPIGKWIVSAGGTGRGLDTAMTIRVNHSDGFMKSKIAKILCMPASYEL